MTRLLLDTNLLIDEPDFSLLSEPGPVQLCTSVLCYVELIEGEFSDDPAVAADSVMRASRAKAILGPGLPFGAAQETAYRAICAAVIRGGRKVGRARRLDMMIAATALVDGLTLATRNIDDFAAVRSVIPVVRL